MRLRFWIVFLALANMGFWLWLYAQSDLGQREPERLKRQFNADKIKVLASTDAAFLASADLPNSARTGVETIAVPAESVAIKTKPEGLPVATPPLVSPPKVATATATIAPNPAPLISPAKVPATPPASPPLVATPSLATAASCLRVGSFNAGEEQSFLRLLKKQNLNHAAKLISLPNSNERFIVYLGPYKNQLQAKQQAQQIKAKSSYAQVSKNAPWQIVLGSFSQKEVAQVGQKRLLGLGIKSKIEHLRQKNVALDFTDLSATQTAQLKNMVKKIRTVQLRACP